MASGWIMTPRGNIAHVQISAGITAAEMELLYMLIDAASPPIERDEYNAEWLAHFD